MKLGIPANLIGARRTVGALLAIGLLLCSSEMSAAATWMARVNGIRQDYDADVLETADGSILLYGSSPALFPVDSYAHLMRVDANGNLTLSKRYAPGYPRGIDETADGGVIVAMSSTAAGPSLVAKLDANGDIVWQYELPVPLENVLVVGDALFLSTSRSWRDAQDNPAVLIVKVDLLTMNVIWSKEFSLGSQAEAAQVVKMRLDRDGGLLLVGDVGIGADNDGFIAKVSPDGAVVASKRLAAPGRQYVRDIVALSDGYAFAGENYEGAGQDDVWVGKLSSSWAFRWQKVMGGCDDDWANNITQLSNGSLQVGASIRSGSNLGGYDMWGINLRSTNTWGVNWQKRFWTLGRDEASGLTKTADGGMVLVGQHSAAPVPDDQLAVLLAKSDSSGAIRTQNGCGSVVSCPAVSNTSVTVTTTTAIVADSASSSSDVSVLLAPSAALTVEDFPTGAGVYCTD